MIDNENSCKNNTVREKQFRGLVFPLVMALLGLAGMVTVLARVILSPRMPAAPLVLTVVTTQNRELPAIWVLLDGLPVILSTGGGDAAKALLEDLHRQGYWHSEAVYAPGNQQGLKALEKTAAALDFGYAAYFGHYRSSPSLDLQSKRLRCAGIAVSSLPALPGPRWHDGQPLWDLTFSRQKPDDWSWHAQFGSIRLAVTSHGEDGILEISGERDTRLVFLERIPRHSSLTLHRWTL